jgi:hypothetical protein
MNEKFILLNGEKEMRFAAADRNGGKGQNHEENLDEQYQEYSNREGRPARYGPWTCKSDDDDRQDQ